MRLGGKGTFAVTVGVGVPLVLAGTAVKNYAISYGDAVGRYSSAQLQSYNVPADGSVSLTDIGRAEGAKTHAELSAFREVAGKKMFGDRFSTVDSQGNVTLYHNKWDQQAGSYTCPEEIPSGDWVGGLPKGRTVLLPDINENGRIDIPLNGDYRSQRKRDVIANSRSRVKAFRDRGML
jgi:hypothetical protein